jgi:hypothetical protein
VNKITENFLKFTKVVVFALFSIQCIYASWWIVQNINTVPYFQIPSESFLYSQVVDILGNAYFIVYILQAVAIFWGVRVFLPKNNWIILFTLTNPLLLQFIFSLTPDIFAVSLVLVLLASLKKREIIKTKHAFFLVALGVLHSRYFLIGLFILVVMFFAQRLNLNNARIDELSRKKKISSVLAIIQVLLVVILVVLSYQTQSNMEDQSTVQSEFERRFTVDETIPSQHSIASVVKGSLEDTISYIFEPYCAIRVIDDLRLTQNNWNYINFTREAPEWSRSYMELSERNGTIVFIVLFVSLIVYFVSVKEKPKCDILFWVTFFAICLLVTVTSKRGMDYRNGLLSIPIWYAFIISFYEKFRVFEKMEDETKV